MSALLSLNPQLSPLTNPTTHAHPSIDEHPQINFMGLLIGPRGATLKKIESAYGAKVMIRGKGSLKEGKSMCRHSMCVCVLLSGAVSIVL